MPRAMAPLCCTMRAVTAVLRPAVAVAQAEPAAFQAPACWHRSHRAYMRASTWRRPTGRAEVGLRLSAVPYDQLSQRAESGANRTAKIAQCFEGARPIEMVFA